MTTVTINVHNNNAMPPNHNSRRPRRRWMVRRLKTSLEHAFVSDESSMSMSVDVANWTDALDAQLRCLLIGDDHATTIHTGYDWRSIADTLGRAPDACRTRWLLLSQSNASTPSDMLLQTSASIQVVIKQSSTVAPAIEQVATVPPPPPASTGIAGIESEEDDTSDLGGMEEELRSPSAVASMFPVATVSGGDVDSVEKDANEVKPMIGKATESTTPVGADADTLIARAVLQVCHNVNVDDSHVCAGYRRVNRRRRRSTFR